MEGECEQPNRTPNNMIVQIVNEYRTMLQQQIALHLKRQRDHLVRMRRRFLSKLAHRLYRNYALYDRTRRHLLMDVTLINTRRDSARRKHYRVLWDSMPTKSGQEFSDEQFEQCRMNQATFQFLFEKLEPELTRIPLLLSTRMKIAIAIYVLGSGKDYASVGTTFGVNSNTVQDCVQMFCRSVIKIFREDVIKMPLDNDSIKDAANEFVEFAGIPQVFGIVGCLHIPINHTGKEPEKYINSKGWSSIILQAVVDRKGSFVDISCEHPGRTIVADMLVNSPLYQRMEQLDAPYETIDNFNVAPLLLGDSKYPLLPWLLTPYPLGENMPHAERSFNVYVAKGRSCISKAFDRLVGRWKVLNRCIDLSTVSEVIITCCILHNVVEQLDSPYLDAWNECHNEEDVAPEQPHWECQIVSIYGEEVRNHLSKYMHDHFPLIVDDED
ncbi:putative nuclease HARBI1 [Anopheles marshallii]|uniref:putative nuclease HARBI1 n=1 Tax=Anopheles marshallii TaxID=1521116 RepID=UPI00237B8A31|nr:putative nuclease HARBI1 [Anopheles marshallii]